MLVRLVSRLGSALLIAAVLLSGTGFAAEPKDPLSADRFGTSLIPANAAMFVSVRVDELLNVPWAKAALKKLGNDNSVVDTPFNDEFFVGKLSNVSRITVIMMPTGEDGEPEPAVIFSTIQPVDRERLMKKVKDRELVESKIGQWTVYLPKKSRHGDGYGILNDTTLVFGTSAGIKQYATSLNEKKSDGSLEGASFKDFDAKAQLIGVMIPKRLIPEEALKDMPDEIKPLAPLVTASWLSLEGRFDDGLSLVAKVKCGKDAVKQTQEASEAGLEMLCKLVATPLENKVFRDDPDNENLVKIVEQLAADLKKTKVQSNGDILQAKFETKLDGDVAAAFMEAVQKVRNTANMFATKSNLRQIGIAMNNIDAQTEKLPEPAIYSKEGKPLLSWRVAILPYLEGDNDEANKVYKQFKLDEPWDSENNKKLLDKMPKIYASPGVELKDKSLTHYKIFVGKDAMFDHGRKTSLAQIPAGTSNTIMVIEAGDPVPWTKPEDIAFDAKKPLPKLVGPYKNVLNILLADVHVLSVPKDIDEKKLRSAINWNVGADLSAPREERRR